MKAKFTRMEDFAYASDIVNGDFLFTQNESGWRKQRSFKDYIQRFDEEFKDVSSPIFIFLNNHPSHINVQLFKVCKDWGIHIVSFPHSANV